MPLISFTIIITVSSVHISRVYNSFIFILSPTAIGGTRPHRPRRKFSSFFLSASLLGRLSNDIEPSQQHRSFHYRKCFLWDILVPIFPRWGVYIILVLILALSPPSAVAFPQLGQSSDFCHMIIEEKVIVLWHWHYHRFEFAARNVLKCFHFYSRVLHCNVA
jgi:hypothetical protein